MLKSMLFSIISSYSLIVASSKNLFFCYKSFYYIITDEKFPVLNISDYTDLLITS